MFLFLVTPCLVVAVQPCMEWIPLKKNKIKKFHLCRISLGMISSHSTFYHHSSCINSLGSNVNGISIPIGLNRELINANIPLLVSSNTLLVGLVDSRSVSKFHKIPSTLSVCTWFFEIFGDISEYGKLSKMICCYIATLSI